MNKLARRILILFAALNVLGGTVLGLQGYIESQEAKRAFEEFYKSDTQVMGAYDKKSFGANNQKYSLYVLGGALFFVLSFSMGAAGAHFIIKSRQKKSKQNKLTPETQPIKTAAPKKIVRL